MVCYKDLDSILRRYAEVIKDTLWSSYTLAHVRKLKPLLDYLKNDSVGIRRMLDLGTGYGVLASIIADYLDVKEAYGVDVSRERIEWINKVLRPHGSGLVGVEADVCNALDFPPNYFDLVTSFGALEHVWCWDEVLENIKRVLRDGGYAMISVPNLGSWVNRIALLLGYQPRDLEISKKKVYGILPMYRTQSVVGHIKGATYRAFKEFLEDNGFHIVKSIPLYSNETLVVNIIDTMLRSPSLARRFIVLAKYIKDKKDV